jgi:hypothetical protein
MKGCTVELDGFNLHAGVAIAGESSRLRRLEHEAQVQVGPVDARRVEGDRARSCAYSLIDQRWECIAQECPL